MEITECSREPMHDGPCNGFPCQWRAYTLVVADQITKVEREIAIIEADLDQKRARRDWHGVMDCSADIREREAELRVLKGL